MTNNLELHPFQKISIGSMGLSHYLYDQDIKLVLDCYVRALYSGVLLPYPGMVLDLFFCVTNRNRKINNRVFNLPNQRRYRDFFLITYERSPECQKLKELSSAYKTDSSMAQYFTRFLELFFHRLNCKTDLKLPAGLIRECVDLKPEVVDLEAAKMLENDEFEHGIDYSDWIDSFQKHHSILNQDDLWELAHILIMDSDSLRYAVKQCYSHRRWLERDNAVNFARIKRELHSIPNSKQTKETGEYPVGGLSEISNKGSLENLLKSELLYMDDEQEVDLFTMRYVEGELLYFKRDTNRFEEFTEKIVLNILPTESYPGKTGDENYPFLLFGIILYWMEMSQKIHASWKFEYHIHFLKGSNRDEEMYNVFHSMLSTRLEVGKINLSLIDTKELKSKSKKLKGVTQINLGGKIIGQTCLYWNKGILFYKSDDDKSKRFIVNSSKPLMQWSNLMFFLLFKKTPRWLEEM
jgi:hypothetical protein